MRYAVRTGSTTNELSREVNLFVAEGWVPHGSMSAVMNNNMMKFFQPMKRLPDVRSENDGNS